MPLKYHVSREGSIVDRYGATLYDAEDIADLSRAAKRRLALVHTKDEEMDWEHAADILKAEGLLAQ